MAVIHRTQGLGWHIAGVLGLLAVCAPVVRAQHPSQVAPVADWRESVPTVAPASVATWTRLLAEKGRLPRRERLVVLSPDGVVLAQADGDERSVRVPAELAEQLCSQALGATLLHNHPEQASFSAADIEVLSRTGVRRVVAVSADGTTFEAEAGSSFHDAWATRLRAELPKRVHGRVLEEAARYDVSPSALALHEPHLTGVILRRLGVLDYRVSTSLTTRLAYDRYREIFDRIVESEVNAAVGASGPNGR
jgi:hypothetical protein